MHNYFKLFYHMVTCVALFISPSSNSQEPLLGGDKSKYPHELATLHSQFQTLFTERVQQPFQKGISELNTMYLAALDKAINAAKTSGDLDATLALKKEKEHFPQTKSIPDWEDAATNASLRALRATYRSEYLKLATVRDTRLRSLTNPLVKRLEQLEGDFTKSDRLNEAQVVRMYRSEISKDDPNFVSIGKLPPTTPKAINGLITNSLGMKFSPLKGTEVFICIHETRRKDYATYSDSSAEVDGSWKNQQCEGIPCGSTDDEPVVGVNWNDAKGFCEWLSKKENQKYRLPTDEEWSIAVGISRDEKYGKAITPSMLDGKIAEIFPWGRNYPPNSKDKSGNYSDVNANGKFPLRPWIKDFDDGFITTAPVMSFNPNKLGIYDLGGNVWEWCEDWYDHAEKARVLRGASWNDGDKTILASSHRRHHHGPLLRNFDCGFRCVIELK